jgi:hypothetical protein
VAAGLRLELAALLDAESMLLVDDDDAERRERDALLDQRVGPDDDRRHPGCDELERSSRRSRAKRSREELDGDPRILEQRRERPMVLAGEQVGRGEQRTLEAAAGRGCKGVCRHGRLARADVTLQQAEHRGGTGEIRAKVRYRGALIARQQDIVAELATNRRGDPIAQGLVRRVVDADRACLIPAPLPAPADHAELEREQLVEREPAKRRVTALERRRVMRLLEGDADPDELLFPGDARRQVLRVDLAGAVQGVANGDPEPRRGEAGGQAVDRHDPPDMEHLVVIALGLEVRIVERQLPAEVLDLA